MSNFLRLHADPFAVEQYNWTRCSNEPRRRVFQFLSTLGMGEQRKKFGTSKLSPSFGGVSEGFFVQVWEVIFSLITTLNYLQYDSYS